MTPDYLSDVFKQFLEFAAPQPTLLTVQLENLTAYYQDTVDLAQLAMQPEVSITASTTPGSQTENFYNMFPLELVGDIASINGDPTGTGLYLSKNLVTISSTTVTPANPDVATINGATITSAGKMISDAPIIGFRDDIFKILYQDPNDPTATTPIEIGSITAAGVSGKPESPGEPSQITGGDWAITGGTGAFLGVTGQMGGQAGTASSVGIRAASVQEDPSQRRINAKTASSPAPPPYFTGTMGLYVIPMMPPQIIAVFHAPHHVIDFPFLVTQDKPAKVGDRLILYATGLGPVRDQSGNAVAIGQPFAANAATVISPVTVTVGNTPAILSHSAQGFEGFTNGYFVNFILPDFSPPALSGTTSIQISSAWIQSAVFTLYVA
jgi:hypothetical protein